MKKPCPICGEMIDDHLAVCPICGEETGFMPKAEPPVSIATAPVLPSDPKPEPKVQPEAEPATPSVHEAEPEPTPEPEPDPSPAPKPEPTAPAPPPADPPQPSATPTPPVTEPKKSKFPIIIGIIVLLAIIGGGLFWYFQTQKSTPPPPVAIPVDTAQVDSTAQQPETVAEEPEATVDSAKIRDSIRLAKERAAIQKSKDSLEAIKAYIDKNGKRVVEEKVTPTGKFGTINLGYGRYRGELRGGKPHGHGTITFTSSHKIVASGNYVAGPGDTFEGEFRDGRVAGGQGIWSHDGDKTIIMP